MTTNAKPIKDRDQCAAEITRFGAAKRKRQDIEARMNAKIAAATQASQPRLDRLKAEMEAMLDRIGLWCENHRFELCQDRAKSANLVTGKIGWRKLPDALRLEEDEEAIIAALEKAKLNQFILTKKTLNKAALLADRAAIEAVAGLSIQTGRELFYIEPFEQEAKP